jgi:hypothetical protein
MLQYGTKQLYFQVPKKYAARVQAEGPDKYGGPGIDLVFTPPYHPELQPCVPPSRTPNQQ